MNRIKRLNVLSIENDEAMKENIKFDDLSSNDKRLFLEFYKSYKGIEDKKSGQIHQEEFSIPLDVIDVICPVYWINDYFFDNIENWFKEIPIGRLFIGVNNSEVKLKVNYPNTKIIDQTYYKTLGMCLADLMQRVKTKWFVFVHADVFIPPNLFSKLMKLRAPNVGIIESDRDEWDGVKTHKKEFHKIPRAYSGLQIFRTSMVKELIEKIEDDFIYRNEDIIFQSECLSKGYKYIKSELKHLHQILNTKWTFSKEATQMMQWKGIIKYTNPDEINKTSLFPVLKHLHDTTHFTLSHCMFFGYENNPNWNEAMRDFWESFGPEFDKLRGY